MLTSYQRNPRTRGSKRSLDQITDEDAECLERINKGLIGVQNKFKEHERVTKRAETKKDKQKGPQDQRKEDGARKKDEAQKKDEARKENKARKKEEAQEAEEARKEEEARKKQEAKARDSDPLTKAPKAQDAPLDVDPEPQLSSTKNWHEEYYLGIQEYEATEYRLRKAKTLTSAKNLFNHEVILPIASVRRGLMRSILSTPLEKLHSLMSLPKNVDTRELRVSTGRKTISSRCSSQNLETKRSRQRRVRLRRRKTSVCSKGGTCIILFLPWSKRPTMKGI